MTLPIALQIIPVAAILLLAVAALGVAAVVRRLDSLALAVGLLTFRINVALERLHSDAVQTRPARSVFERNPTRTGAVFPHIPTRVARKAAVLAAIDRASERVSA